MNAEGKAQGRERVGNRRKMKRSCPYCGRIHDSKYDCGRRPRRRYTRRPEEQGRYTDAWKRKSAEIRRQSHYLCAVCLARGVLTYDDLSVHHIVKLTERPDLLLDDDNLVCLCRAHHEMADRGQLPTGYLTSLARARQHPPEGVCPSESGAPLPTPHLHK